MLNQQIAQNFELKHNIKSNPSYENKNFEDEFQTSSYITEKVGNQKLKIKADPRTTAAKISPKMDTEIQVENSKCFHFTRMTQSITDQTPKTPKNPS